MVQKTWFIYFFRAKTLITLWVFLWKITFWLKCHDKCNIWVISVIHHLDIACMAALPHTLSRSLALGLTASLPGNTPYLRFFKTHPVCPAPFCLPSYTHRDTSCGLWTVIPWLRWISPAAPQPSSTPRQSMHARRYNIRNRTAAVGTERRRRHHPRLQKWT